jgi:apolipoprotein N-acyltransferase
MAVFRAVETRRWVLRAATTGISAVIAPSGGLRERLETGMAGVLRADIGLPTELTPYVRVGDVFAWTCVVGLLAGLAAARRPRSLA